MLDSLLPNAFWQSRRWLILTSFFSLHLAHAADFRLPEQPGVLKIVTYNVENLFDTQHDFAPDGSDKNDAEFLPADHPNKKALCRLNQSDYYYRRCLKSDWNEDRLDLKLDQIKKALELQGDLPDILGVQEIENRRVASRLASRLGYSHFVMTESPDARGIDVAIFYRSRLLTLTQFSSLRLTQKRATRDMGVATFALRGGGKLTAVVCHWPSQSNSSAARVDAARALLKTLGPQLKEKNHSVVVMGDFNTTWEDTPNPYHNGLIPGGLVEARRWALAEPHPLYRDMPPGSYWYAKQNVWNPFDTFFLSPDLVDGKGRDSIRAGYRIVAAPELMKSYGFKKGHSSRFFAGGFLPRVPKRYDHRATSAAGAGFSDHLPIVLQIRLNPPPAKE